MMLGDVLALARRGGASLEGWLRPADPALAERLECAAAADGTDLGGYLGALTASVTNPSTGEVLATLPDSGVAEAKAAIEAAHGAQSAWAAKTGKERAAVLRKFHELMVANADDLTRLKGVGQKFASRLNELGIGRYEQIAGFNDNEIAALEQSLRLEEGALDHDFWSDSEPCSMHIEEVEALWSKIDERDDWEGLNAKILEVRRMGEALRASDGADA